jgi:hypothetical protein
MMAEDLLFSMDAQFSKCSDIEIKCINHRVLTLEGPTKNIFYKNSFVDMYKN